jgi:hypothetical protein
MFIIRSEKRKKRRQKEKKDLSKMIVDFIGASHMTVGILCLMRVHSIIRPFRH